MFRRKYEKVRMRGGGSGEVKAVSGSAFKTDADFTWYNSRFSATKSRLEGGGGEEVYRGGCCGKNSGASKINHFQTHEDYLQLDRISPSYLAGNKCRLRHNEDSALSCLCPGKDALESAMKRNGQEVCRKKPCTGPDCLFKAFQDCKEFVESIGTGPGLGGLGIVESPYFGTGKEQKEARRATSSGRAAAAAEPAASPCCPAENPRPGPAAWTGSATKRPAPAVQEGPAALPEPGGLASSRPPRKREDKPEKPRDEPSGAMSHQPPAPEEQSPCGEAKCRSRPARPRREETAAGDSAEEKPPGPGAHRASPAHKDKKWAGAKGSRSAPGLAKPARPNRFDLSFGNAYPSSVYGHKQCNATRARVPAHMGWQWDKYDEIAKLRPKPGWRPGAISLQMRDMLNEAKAGFLKSKRPRSAPSKSKKGGKAAGPVGVGPKKHEGDEEVEEELEFPPTLHVHRKDGVYYVTMYPIRQEPTGAREHQARLDEPTNPLQFKIVKSKGSIASSSTASDMEIEFSPPAAVNRQRRRPNVVHVETQVRQQQILDEATHGHHQHHLKQQQPPPKDHHKKDKGKRKSK